MTELKREELLRQVSMWLLGCAHDTEIPYKGCTKCPSKKICKQAHRQIKELIQASTNLENKSLRRLAEDLGVSFSATKIISDHAQLEVTPAVDEGFVNTWAKVFAESLYSDMPSKIKYMLKEAGVEVSG